MVEFFPAIVSHLEIGNKEKRDGRRLMVWWDFLDHLLCPPTDIAGIRCLSIPPYVLPNNFGIACDDCDWQWNWRGYHWSVLLNESTFIAYPSDNFTFTESLHFSSFHHLWSSHLCCCLLFHKIIRTTDRFWWPATELNATAWVYRSSLGSILCNAING